MDDACARLGVHRLPHPYAEAPTDDPAIGRMFDAWLVLARLGSGAMGAVYLAEQQPVGLRGALKLVTRSAAIPTDDARFAREAAALARLSHPHIVRLMAYGIARHQPYLVMEYVRGGRTLRDVLPELDLAERRRVLVQISHALEAAHAEGVIHRDLKPDNVMVQSVAGDPRFVRLVDFGLAKFSDESDRSTIAAGSPRYMAPEQATRRPIGPWTDLYALGVMACELLADHLPFGDGGVQAVLLRKVDPAHDPLGDLDRPLTPALVDFLRRAMASEPEERFSDARTMRAALPALQALPDTVHLARTHLSAAPEAIDTAALGATQASVGEAVGDAERPPRRWPAWAGVGLATVGVLAVTLAGADDRPPPEVDAMRDAIARAAEPDATTGIASAPDARSAVEPSGPMPVDATSDARPDAMPDVAPDAARPPRQPTGPRPPRPRPARPRPEPAAPPATGDIGSSLDMPDTWTKEKSR